MKVFGKKSSENHGLLGNATDYTVIHASLRHYLQWFLMGFVIAGGVFFVFYSSVLCGLAVGILAGFIYLPIRSKQEIIKRQKQLKLQFKELLDALATSLSVGKNVDEAFIAAKVDLSIQFPIDADITQEVEIILNGLRNNINAEDLLEDFGTRTQLEEVTTFASVFKTTHRKGGNIREIIKSTADIINEKIDIENEIDTLVSGKKNEQKIMMFMPIIFILILKSMGGELINLHSKLGIISMTIAIALFSLAYLISRKIMRIRI